LSQQISNIYTVFKQLQTFYQRKPLQSGTELGCFPNLGLF